VYVCRSVEAGGKRTVSLYEQDSFEDEFVDLGTCVAMYPFEGKQDAVRVCLFYKINSIGNCTPSLQFLTYSTLNPLFLIITHTFTMHV